MRCLPLASSLFAAMAFNSQSGPAAASPMRLGRRPAAAYRAFPEGPPSGGRPQASPPSNAVAVRVPPPGDRHGAERGLGSVDAGVSFPQRNLDDICPQGFVECVDGQEHDQNGSTGKTCKVACDGDCCFGGSEECDFFTGKVCRDGSCEGDRACYETGKNGNVGPISGPSCVEPHACRRAGLNGNIESISGGSCTGRHACREMAKHAGSTIGHIHASCKGTWACTEMASNDWADGNIGPITNSCIGQNACMNLGLSGDPTTIPSGIINSCHGHQACQDVRGTIPAFYNCCISFQACIGETVRTLPAQCAGTPSPTNAPTTGPTSSPTPSNIWTLDLIDTAASLAAGGDDDIKFTYLIAAGRAYETSLLQKGCDTKYEVDGALYNVTNSTAVINSTHQWLNVSYSLDKEALASSPIWNNITSAIELCQVTSLYEMTASLVKLVVATSATELEVLVNSIANFTIATNLTSETIFNETEEVDAAAAVRAFKCDEKFERNDAKLSPNNEMFTCVGSADDAFKVDTVDRMTISQDGKNDLKVIDGGKTLIPSITRVDYHEKGIIVGSRIPINLFDFEEGKILTIEGAVTMKLADGSSRRLNVDLGSIGRNLQEESNEASYTVDVALQAAEESAIGLSNSAAGVAAAALKGFAVAAFFLLL